MQQTPMWTNIGELINNLNISSVFTTADVIFGNDEQHLVRF